MTTVAVTGGAGFIGSNLVQSLVDLGHDVIVIDDLSTGFLSNLDLKTCTFHKISVVDRDALEKALFPAEVIFHFAALTSVPQSIKQPVTTYEVNGTGTLNVLEVARKTGAHFLFASSASVYGRNEESPKDEGMWLGPISPYAASKLAGEAYAQAYASSYGIPVTVLRFFNVFGPRQRPEHEYAAVIPKWIWQALKEEPIDIHGDGTQTRDFTFVKDIVEVCLGAMNRKVTSEGPINLAFGDKVTLLDLVEIIRSFFPNLESNFKGARAGDVKFSVNNPAFMKQLFPEVRPTDFRSAFVETLDWLRTHTQESPKD
jgi:UDP-glucose 4-epimerase